MTRPAAWTRPAGRPFVLLGGACVIGGGLLSAAMAPAASYHSSWAVAYIVLIAGVAQAALGLGQTALTGGDVPRRVVRAELAGWNLGNAAVVAGTLLEVAPVLYTGCALLVAALMLVLYAIRHAQPGRVLVATRVIVALLLISMPIGIVLQALDH
ncbi:MAG: hypothetical protein ACRDNT_31475 [Streptosporangiaceae bacterium]